VDWCDAYAYCKAVGKRLCGKIGGGANAFADHSNVDLDQWVNACSSHGANLYAANGTDPRQCNVLTGNQFNTRPVPTMSTCQSSVSGYTGVYDLTGNVWEWEDSCDGTLGTSNYCHVRGADYIVDDRDGGLQCAKSTGSRARDEADGTTGFRCCSL
jgi:formylglycine-generating enzyme required for sulfatase activity